MKRDTLAVVLIVFVGLFLLGAADGSRSEVGRWHVIVGNWDGETAFVAVDTVTGRTFWRSAPDMKGLSQLVGGMDGSGRPFPASWDWIPFPPPDVKE